jgi:hypothetical protein
MLKTDYYSHAGLVLLIPVAKTNASQRVQMPLDTSYDDALETIYDTIGCASVTRKPELTYRLSCSAAKASHINLMGSDDWDGCKEDVEAAEKKKKEKVSVNIMVPEIVSNFHSCMFQFQSLLTFEKYLASMHAHKSKTTASTKVSAKGKKGKPVLMNLDDDEDEEAVAEELKEQEEVCLSQLEKALSRCAKCGDDKRCKIDKMGNHVHLTFQQLRSWALSLVSFPDPLKLSYSFVLSHRPQINMESRLHHPRKLIISLTSMDVKPCLLSPVPTHPNQIHTTIMLQSTGSCSHHTHIIFILRIMTIATIRLLFMVTVTSIYFITRTSINLPHHLAYALLHLNCHPVTPLGWNLILSFSIFSQNSILNIPAADLRNTQVYSTNLIFTTSMKLHDWVRISLYLSFA